MRIYGHRGAMAAAPQNTMASFFQAQDEKAHGLELDVQVSSDAKAFVFHDDTLDMLTDGAGPLQSKKAKEVRELDAGSKFNPGFAGERIPLLSEVIDTFGASMLLNVEIKTPYMAYLQCMISGQGDLGALDSIVVPEQYKQKNRSYLDTVLEDLRRGPGGEGLGAYLGLLISSFDPFALHELSKMEPSLGLAFLSMPTQWSKEAVRLDGIAEELLGTVLHAWHPHFSQVDAALLAHHHGRGRDINVWTVNDPASARSLADLGVDGIISNCPGVIRTALGH